MLAGSGFTLVSSREGFEDISVHEKYNAASINSILKVMIVKKKKMKAAHLT